MISGGVMTAARIRITTIACLRYFFKNSGSMISSLANKQETIGNKKNNLKLSDILDFLFQDENLKQKYVNYIRRSTII